LDLAQTNLNCSLMNLLKNPKVLLFLISLMLFAFTTYRAIKLSMTHDESSTYINYHDKNVFDCFHSEACWGSANNHLLNTFLMQQSLNVFGTKEWTIRLPNLLAHLIYLVFSALLVLSITRKTLLVLVGFSLLNFNPYFLDFFSLARGYGLSMAFIMASLYWLNLFLKKQKPGIIAGIFISAFLAVMSNFTALNFYASLWIGFFALSLFIFYNEKNISFRKVIVWQLWPLFIALISAALLWKPLKFLMEKDEFKWGVDNILDTFLTLTQDSLYGQKYLSGQTTSVFLAISGILILCAFAVIFINFYKKQTHKDSKIFVATGVIFCSIILIMLLQNLLLDSKFFINRKSLVFIPIAGLLIFLALNSWQEKIPKTIKWVAILLLLFNGYHLGRASNFESCREWGYDAKTKEMLLYLKENYEKEDEKIKLGVNWFFHPTTYFYKETLDLDFFPVFANGTP